MDKRLEDLQQRLLSSSNPWCESLSNQIIRLSSCLTNRLPIYRTRLTREQLLASIKAIEELEITSQTNDLYRRSLANYLVLLSIHTHKLVSGILLEHLYHLRHHLHYWKDEESTASGIIDQLKTSFWFDRDRDDIRTIEKIKFLKLQEELLSNIIGRLAYTITNLEQQEQLNLDSITSYTNELYKILFDGTSVNYNSQSDLSDLLELYSQMLNSFEEFENRWKEKTHLFYRPTHFKRYFTYYICFTAIGFFTIYKVYTNRAGILDYVCSTYDSLKFFVNEHLLIPLKTIYSSTFQSRSSENTFENSQLNYTNSKMILKEMLADYGQQHASALAEIHSVSVEEFLGTLNQRATDEDMNIVMKYYQQELNSPIRSALVGDLIKGILIQVQKVKVDGEGLVIQIDQLMKQNEINFSLLATIPAILLITFFSMATKNIVANRLIKQRTFDLSTLRQKIINKLREIEHVLIFNSEKPALIINHQDLLLVEAADQQPVNTMTYFTFGHLLSLLYELKYYTNQLKSKRMHSKEFNDDINFLTYTQLTVKQKLRILQQISHSYSFLVHA